MGGPVFFKKVLPNCACSIGWCEVAARRHCVIAACRFRLLPRRVFEEGAARIAHARLEADGGICSWASYGGTCFQSLYVIDD